MNSQEMALLEKLIEPSFMPFFVAIVAIVVFGFARIVRLFLSHRERIAMIRQGMHPDDHLEKPIVEKKPH